MVIRLRCAPACKRVIQLRDRRRDDFDLFAAERAGFAGMRIQACDGDAARTAAAGEKVFEEQTNTHDFGAPEALGHIGEGNVRGDEGDGEAAAGQEHGEVFDPAARGEKFRLAGEGKPNFVHARLVDRGR